MGNITQGGCIVRFVIMIGIAAIGVRYSQRFELGTVATVAVALLAFATLPLIEFIICVALDRINPTTTSHEENTEE